MPPHLSVALTVPGNPPPELTTQLAAQYTAFDKLMGHDMTLPVSNLTPIRGRSPARGWSASRDRAKSAVRTPEDRLTHLRVESASDTPGAGSSCDDNYIRTPQVVKYFLVGGPNNPNAPPGPYASIAAAKKRGLNIFWWVAEQP